jgi:hypothetical protein
MNKDFESKKEPEEKEYGFKIENKGGYLEATARGKRTREAVSALTIEFGKAGFDFHSSKILVDVRELEGSLKVYDSYQIVTQDFRKLRGKGIQKAAIIDRKVPGVRGWFLETVAVNRGFNLRVFTDRQAALEWLLGEPLRNRV